MPLEKIKTGGLHTAWLLSPPGVIRSHAPHLPGRRPSSAVYHFGGYEPYYQVLLTHGSPGKDIADKDNPIHSSGEAKDWTPFKEGIQARADSHETTWLFEGGRSLVLPKKKVLYQTNQGQDWHPGCSSARRGPNRIPTMYPLRQTSQTTRSWGSRTKLHSGRSLVAILFIIICRRYFRSTDF